MHTPLRVGFVLHGMQVAGAEMLVWEIIQRLGRTLDPSVLCLDSVGPLGERLRAQGVPVVHLERRPGRDLRVAWRLALEIRARCLQLLHCHQYSPCFYGVLARVLSGRWPSLIFTEHGRHYPDPVQPLRRAVNRLFLDPLIDAVNAVAAFSACRLKEVDGFAGSRIEVIENGIDVERYRRPSDRDGVCRRLGLDPVQRFVVHVARFHPVKDQATLLRGFQRLARAQSGVELLLVGDGPLRGDLEKLARELDVAERVRFLGLRDDVPEILSAADVFVLSSLSEAAPLTLMEAMACGLPVVVTRVGGHPEMVNEGVEGWLVERGNHVQLGDALARVLADPREAADMGAAGRAKARTRWRIEETVRRYRELYLGARPDA